MEETSGDALLKKFLQNGAIRPRSSVDRAAGSRSGLGLLADERIKRGERLAEREMDPTLGCGRTLMFLRDR